LGAAGRQHRRPLADAGRAARHLTRGAVGGGAAMAEAAQSQLTAPSRRCPAPGRRSSSDSTAATAVSVAATSSRPSVVHSPRARRRAGRELPANQAARAAWRACMSACRGSHSVNGSVPRTTSAAAAYRWPTLRPRVREAAQRVPPGATTGWSSRRHLESRHPRTDRPPPGSTAWTTAARQQARTDSVRACCRSTIGSQATRPAVVGQGAEGVGRRLSGFSRRLDAGRYDLTRDIPWPLDGHWMAVDS
jgi:hypothetical protein